MVSDRLLGRNLSHPSVSKIQLHEPEQTYIGNGLAEENESVSVQP